MTIRSILSESGARPTHPGAETVLSGDIASFLDNLSKQWHEVSDPINKERNNQANKV